MAWVSNSWQKGHCRSTYSTSVVGAVGRPSTFRCCGMPLRSLSISAAPLGQLVSSRCNSTARRRSELESGERVESGGLHVPAQASGLERGTTFIADGGRSQRRGDPVEHRAAYGTPRGLEELLRLMSQPAYRSTLVFLRLSQRVARVAFAL